MACFLVVELSHMPDRPVQSCHPCLPHHRELCLHDPAVTRAVHLSGERKQILLALRSSVWSVCDFGLQLFNHPGTLQNASAYMDEQEIVVGVIITAL
jgi:hypothetical protein